MTFTHELGLDHTPSAILAVVAFIFGFALVMFTAVIEPWSLWYRALCACAFGGGMVCFIGSISKFLRRA